MIALEGSWEGHPMGGFALDKSMLNQMVTNAKSGQTEIPADYEHATLWSSFFGGKAPASGWINKLELREGAGGEGQLWVRVGWTNTAATHIREREYRYLSPVIVFNSRDRKSGKLAGAAIHSLALTNTPFLEELPEVRLNKLPIFTDEETALEDEIMTKDQIAQLCKALGLSVEAAPEEVLAMAAKASERTVLASTILEGLGLSPETKAEDVTAAITVLKNPANDPQEVSALRARVVELEGDKARREAGDLVARALEAGKLTAPGTPQHVWALKFAEENPKAFSAWLDAAPPVVPNKPVTPAKTGPVAVAQSEDARKFSAQLGLSDEDWKEFGNQI